MTTLSVSSGDQLNKIWEFVYGTQQRVSSAKMPYAITGFKSHRSMCYEADSRLNVQENNLEELCEAIITPLSHIPKAILQNLVEYRPRRLKRS